MEIRRRSVHSPALEKRQESLHQAMEQQRREQQLMRVRAAQREDDRRQAAAGYVGAAPRSAGSSRVPRTSTEALMGAIRVEGGREIVDIDSAAASYSHANKPSSASRSRIGEAGREVLRRQESHRTDSKTSGGSGDGHGDGGSGTKLRQPTNYDAMMRNKYTYQSSHAYGDLVPDNRIEVGSQGASVAGGSRRPSGGVGGVPPRESPPASGQPTPSGSRRPSRGTGYTLDDPPQQQTMQERRSVRSEDKDPREKLRELQ